MLPQSTPAARVQVACEQCGALFGVKASDYARRGAKYCSKTCYVDSQRGKRKPYLVGGGGKGAEKLRGRPQTAEHKAKRAAATQATLASQRRLCVGCGDEFTPTLGSQLYCSNRCWTSKNRAARARKERVTVPPQVYEAILAEQGGGCAICGVAPQPPGSGRAKGRLCVDHCHAMGTVRGLLCHRCNTALGLFGDDPERLRRAIRYLESG